MIDTLYALVLSFPDQSPNYCYGFEAGGIWQRMKDGHEAEIEFCGRDENLDCYRRMCVALGWSFDSKPTSVDGWTDYTLTKVAKVPERSNPHGLRVVE